MNVEREQCDMRIAEMESWMLNMAPNPKYVDELVQHCETGLVLRNVSDARNLIMKFIGVVKKKDHTIEFQKIQLEHKDKLVYAYQKKNNIEQQLTKEAGTHRRYY